MRKLVVCLSGAIVMALASCPAQAQQYQELDYFSESAGDLSIIFRGRQAERYDFTYNGNCFWKEAAYRVGDIIYRGKFYGGIELNLDAVLQAPLVRLDSGHVPIGLYESDVEYMKIGGSVYENLRLKGHREVKEGFYEILADGEYRLYKRVDKRVETSVDNVNGPEIGYEDPFYKDNIHTYFKYFPTYYLSHNGGPLVRFRNKGALMNLFPEHKKALRKHLSSISDGGVKLESEESFIEIVKFVCQ